jgi:hypothetical protein
MQESGEDARHTHQVSTLPKQPSRTDRLRDYTAAIDLARARIAAMGVLVQAREARATAPLQSLELLFAAAEVDGRALPAAVWVALRRGSVDAAIDAMTSVSKIQFLIEEREEIGEGYRLQTVQETRPLPEVDLLLAQLAGLLGIPVDVLTVLAEWGADDPRLSAEVDELLDSRFGPVTRPQHDLSRRPVETHAAEPCAPPKDRGRLELSVAQAADVLRLDEEQARTLATLVECANVILTA